MDDRLVFGYPACIFQIHFNPFGYGSLKQQVPGPVMTGQQSLKHLITNRGCGIIIV